jgi:hypothetical protein
VTFDLHAIASPADCNQTIQTGAGSCRFKEHTLEHVCQLQVLVGMQRQRQARLDVKQAPDHNSNKQEAVYM